MIKINKDIMSEILGWYGILALITAYFLVTFSIIQPQGLEFQLLNVTGSGGLMAVAITKKVTQSVLLNIFWIAIGIVAIYNIYF
jgi:hypothetical protein